MQSTKFTFLIAATMLLAQGCIAHAVLAAVPTGLAAPAASAAVPASTVTLRLKYVTGEVLKYHMTMAITSSTVGVPMKINSNADMMLVQTVQDVDEQGNATLLVQMDNPFITMVMNGQSTPMPTTTFDKYKSGFTEVISPRGSILSIKSNAPLASEDNGTGAASAGVPGLTGLMDPGQLGALSLLPDHPVKIDDIWRNTATLASIGGQMYVKMALIGFDKSNGSTIANIATRFSADMKPSADAAAPMTGQMTGTGRNTFDVERGELTSMSSAANTDMSFAMPSAAAAGQFKMTMTMTTQMDLVSGG